jgi:DNA repair protein SbcD/Mre11
MRKELREVLGGANLKTVILPGNHDYQSYRSGLYFGENVYVLSDWTTPLDFGEVTIWGLPFEKLEGERLVSRLREMGALMNQDRYNLLLFHGELLDAYYSPQDMGGEGTRRHMPVHLSYFSPLPVKYVLGGHFHSGYKGWEISGDSFFIYPGSPVAITRRETGRRYVNMISPGNRPVEIELDTFHYEELTVNLDPFEAANPLETIEKRIKETHPAAAVLLTVQGLFDGNRLGFSESELAAGIRKVAGDKLAGEPVENYSDVQHVIEDELFKLFLSKLDHKDYSKQEQAMIREQAIKAFRVVKACT